MSTHVLQSIPKGTMAYDVECVIYGASNAREIGVRQILLKKFRAWADNTRSAEDTVAKFLEEHHIELVKMLTTDVVAGIVREQIVNDPSFDFSYVALGLREPIADAAPPTRPGGRG